MLSVSPKLVDNFPSLVQRSTLKTKWKSTRYYLGGSIKVSAAPIYLHLSEHSINPLLIVNPAC